VGISLMRKKEDRIEFVIEDNDIGFHMESMKKILGIGSKASGILRWIV